MKRYRFEAALQRSTGWGAWVIFPHSTQQEFGTKGRVPIQALMGGVAYTGSLMPLGTGFHRLAVPRPVCLELRKSPGDLITVELWQDEAPRTVEMPQEFVHLLEQHRLRTTFESLTITRRKEYRNWITSAKREETRLRRMKKALELLVAERKYAAPAHRP